MKMKELLEEAKGDLEEMKRNKAKQIIVDSLLRREANNENNTKLDEKWEQDMERKVDEMVEIDNNDVHSHYNYGRQFQF